MPRSGIAVLLLMASPLSAQLPMLGFSGGSGGTRGGGFQGRATFQVPRPMLRMVKGAPYSGQQTDESVQKLADGNTVTNSTGFHQKAWRDSQGRVRVERSAMPGPTRLKGVPTVVEIQDPVAGFSYIMDDVTRVAHRTKLDSSPSPSRPPVRPSASPGDLGTRIIDGIEAVGTQTITTIPPNAARGNDQPSTLTREEWKSLDLQLTILAITTDSRRGTTTSKIANLSRIEPDPTLFFVPAGYTVVDESQSFTIQWGTNQ